MRNMSPSHPFVHPSAYFLQLRVSAICGGMDPLTFIPKCSSLPGCKSARSLTPVHVFYTCLPPLFLTTKSFAFVVSPVKTKGFASTWLKGLNPQPLLAKKQLSVFSVKKGVQVSFFQIVQQRCDETSGAVPLPSVKCFITVLKSKSEPSLLKNCCNLQSWPFVTSFYAFYISFCKHIAFMHIHFEIPFIHF